MPKEKELSKGKGATVPPKPSNNPAPTIVPSSPPALIESKVNLPQVELPAFLQRTEMPELAGRQLTGYVGFAHPMSKNWPLMAAAGCEEGMPYLNHQGRFIACKTLEFFLCRGETFKTVMNDRGKFIFATRDIATTEVNGPIIGVNRQSGNRVILLPEGGKVIPDPHYICLLIVNLNGTLIPIKGDFRGTKSGGIETCIRAVETAGTPEWGKLSEAHKVSLAFPVPFGRVYHTIRTKPNVSKSSGRPFHTAIASSNPASVSQMQLLANTLANEDFKTVLIEANNNFDKRLEYMDDIADNGPTD